MASTGRTCFVDAVVQSEFHGRVGSGGFALHPGLHIEVSTNCVVIHEITPHIEPFLAGWLVPFPSLLELYGSPVCPLLNLNRLSSSAFSAALEVGTRYVCLSTLPTTALITRSSFSWIMRSCSRISFSPNDVFCTDVVWSSPRSRSCIPPPCVPWAVLAPATMFP